MGQKLERLDTRSNITRKQSNTEVSIDGAVTIWDPVLLLLLYGIFTASDIFSAIT